MAARVRKIRHDENTRIKIKASQLINRLMDHVFGKVEMQPSQVNAALGLLKKVLPDMAAVKVSGDLPQNYVARMPAVAETSDEWQRLHAPTIQ